MILYLITLRGGNVIEDSLQPGGLIQLYPTRTAAERDLKLVLAREKQIKFEVKPVDLNEAAIWVK